MCYLPGYMEKRFIKSKKGCSSHRQLLLYGYRKFVTFFFFVVHFTSLFVYFDFKMHTCSTSNRISLFMSYGKVVLHLCINSGKNITRNCCKIFGYCCISKNHFAHSSRSNVGKKTLQRTSL